MKRCKNCSVSPSPHFRSFWDLSLCSVSFALLLIDQTFLYIYHDAPHQKQSHTFVISLCEPCNFSAYWKANLVWSMSAAVMMERETVEARLAALRQSEMDRFQAEQEAAELAAKIAREKAEAIDIASAVG